MENMSRDERSREILETQNTAAVVKTISRCGMARRSFMTATTTKDIFVRARWPSHPYLNVIFSSSCNLIALPRSGYKYKCAKSSLKSKGFITIAFTVRMHKFAQKLSQEPTKIFMRMKNE